MRVICYQMLKCMQTLNRVLKNSALMVFKRMKSTNGLHVQQVLYTVIHLYRCLLTYVLCPWKSPPASMTSKLCVSILDIVAGGGGSHPLQILGSRYFFGGEGDWNFWNFPGWGTDPTCHCDPSNSIYNPSK